MADIKELDPLFKAPPGQTASNADSGSDLTKLDPIFGNPIGVDPSVSKAAKDVMGAKGSVFGLPRNEERGLAAAAGAVAGPTVQKIAEKAFPSAETRQLEAAKKLQETAKLDALKQEIINQELQIGRAHV